MTMEHVPTPSATAGPFLHLGLTEHHSVTQIAGPTVKGERICLRCRIWDAEGSPVTDAMIEAWQADAEGRYHHPDDPRGKDCDPAFLGFGRAATDETGCCIFETVKPGRVPAPDGRLQAPHISIAIYARGILLQLQTRVYFAGDAANEADPVLALVPEERRNTLLAARENSDPPCWVFEIRLRGENETVFFDV
jgi:protocatechuate 3,4-dioxygenase alpha subunit